MSEIIGTLSRKLDSSEVEIRVQNKLKKNNYGVVYALLVLYKTSWTDTARLNEACGIDWRNSFFYDKKDNLCCRIEIYNEKTAQWISREDVGTEPDNGTSRQDIKTKGNRSDAFKRAGSRWGIGNELRKMPVIKVKLDDVEYYEDSGKIKLSNKCDLETWVASYDFEENKVKNLKIVDTYGKTRYSQKVYFEQEKENETDDLKTEAKKLCYEKGLDFKDELIGFKQAYGIKEEDQFDIQQAKDFVAALKKLKNKKIDLTK